MIFDRELFHKLSLFLANLNLIKRKNYKKFKNLRISTLTRKRANALFSQIVRSCVKKFFEDIS